MLITNAQKMALKTPGEIIATPNPVLCDVNSVRYWRWKSTNLCPMHSFQAGLHLYKLDCVTEICDIEHSLCLQYISLKVACKLQTKHQNNAWKSEKSHQVQSKSSILRLQTSFKGQHLQGPAWCAAVAPRRTRGAGAGERPAAAAQVLSNYTGGGGAGRAGRCSWTQHTSG